MSLALRQGRINGNDFVYKYKHLGLNVWALPAYKGKFQPRTGHEGPEGE